MTSCSYKRLTKWLWYFQTNNATCVNSFWWKVFFAKCHHCKKLHKRNRLSWKTVPSVLSTGKVLYASPLAFIQQFGQSKEALPSLLASLASLFKHSEQTTCPHGSTRQLDLKSTTGSVQSSRQTGHLEKREQICKLFLWSTLAERNIPLVFHPIAGMTKIGSSSSK